MGLITDSNTGYTARNTKKLRKAQTETNERLDALAEQLAETNALLRQMISQQR